MTIYYDPQASIIFPLMKWKGTVFSMVLTSGEFWVYILMHLAAVTLAIYGIKEGDIDPFRWEAAAAMQFFMTFFLTFYNAKCYDRYMELYPACMDLNDSVVLFVHELSVSLHHDIFRKYRVGAAKYMLAAVFEFYMIITGGSMQKHCWREIVKKGLLTKTEGEMLNSYPGGRCTLVLTSWALFLVKDALEREICWHDRMEQTTHIYQRLQQNVVQLVKASNKIANTIAMPIPYAYFHLMNVILELNIILLITMPALFKRYMTVVPFAAALLIFMGLRDIAAALADPFGQDDVDFPIAAFLNHTFDRTIAILEPFNLPEARMHAIDAIELGVPFNDDQLCRPCKPSILYDKFSKPSKHNAFTWSTPPASRDIEEDVLKIWRLSLATAKKRPKEATVAEIKEVEKEPPEMEELRRARIRKEELLLEIADARTELEKMRLKALASGFSLVEDLRGANASIQLVTASQPQVSGTEGDRGPFRTGQHEETMNAARRARGAVMAAGGASASIHMHDVTLSQASPRGSVGSVSMAPEEAAAARAANSQRRSKHVV